MRHMNREAWFKGETPMSNVWGITAYLMSGTYSVQANAPSTLGAGSFGLNNYTTASDVNDAIAAFVETMGFPWVAIGDAANIVSSGTETDYVLALNFGSAFVPALSSGGGGIVVTSNRSISTAGFEPWANFADAFDAFMAMTGNYVWP